VDRIELINSMSNVNQIDDKMLSFDVVGLK